MEDNAILNQHDLVVMNNIIRSGKDVIIRQTSTGISILAEKVELRKRKDKPKTE